MTRLRVFGLGLTAGAFFAFGMAPLVTAPAANADEFDVIVDPIISALSGIDPTLGADLGALATSFDPTFAADSAASAATAAATPDFSELFNQFVYTPTHTALEHWITSNVGQQVDGFINSVAGSDVIGNGAPGTQADPTGGAGGWLFGDGGAGWNSTDPGVAGGEGGAAGIIGNGGVGGEGGPGADGGDGGAGGSFLGIGGDGGNAGDGTAPDGLPALGGAGGDSSVFGIHGMVGDFGTGSGDPSGADSLGTTGSFLTNSDGQVVMLHGLNEVYKIAPGEPSASGFSDDDAAFLAANGFNAVRVGVIWSDLEPEPGVFNSAYLASIESTVQTLGNHGIYSIIDFHQDAYSTAFGGEGAPAWATETNGATNVSLPFPYNEFFDPAEQQAWDSFWSNADAPNSIGLEDNYSQMLEYVASAFNGNSNVAGFELMNEPIPGLIDVPVDPAGRLVLRQSAADAVLRPGVRRDPGRRSDHTDFLRAQRPLQRGLAHRSWPCGRHQHRLVVPRLLRVRPGVAGLHTGRQRVVGNAEAYAEAQGIPAFMTEFGATSDQTAIAAPMQGADQQPDRLDRVGLQQPRRHHHQRVPTELGVAGVQPRTAADWHQRQHRQPGHARRALPAGDFRYPDFVLV